MRFAWNSDTTVPVEIWLVGALVSAGIVTGLGFVAGFGASKIYYSDRMYGIQTESRGEIYSWPGPSSATEARADMDTNGIKERWMMEMWPSNNPSFAAAWYDDDQNGVKENCIIVLLTHHENRRKDFRSAVSDADQDGVFDTLKFAVDVDDEVVTRYEDLDLDGRFDLLLDRQKNLTWIITGDEFIRVLEHKSPKFKRVSAQRSNGDVAEFYFEGGAWREVISTNQEQSQRAGE